MSLSDQLDRLAAFEPVPYPVVSLYLNTQPGQTGRDQFQQFIRKEFTARGRTYPPNSPERESLDRDLERIKRYLDAELQPSANSVVVFACSAANLFEPVQLGAPIDRHWLYIGDQPHLYPLARIESQYPRYAAVLVDTNMARILVFASGELVGEQDVQGTRTRRHSQGGWSQARFQRHIENYHVQHIKDVVDALERIVQEEGIEQILLAGDEIALPLLREHLHKPTADRVVDHMRLATNASVSDILAASLQAMARVNERTAREKVESAIGAYRAGGLGVAGPDETLDALVKGQVDELLVSASLRELHGVAGGAQPGTATADDGAIAEPAIESTAAGEPADVAPDAVRLADELITRAAQTSARITFIEDPTLLAPFGGVAALLRFRI
jgi:peptide chain release factor subunit 1